MRKLVSDSPAMAYKDVTWTLHGRYTDVTGRYRTLQDVTGRYRTLQDVIGRYTDVILQQP